MLSIARKAAGNNAEFANTSREQKKSWSRRGSCLLWGIEEGCGGGLQGEFVQSFDVLQSCPLGWVCCCPRTALALLLREVLPREKPFCSLPATSGCVSRQGGGNS